ncbi:hypothetical protein HP532_08930 [Pseudomonas sp. CrR25]|nr:hypothetical protein [Pseudomonas sp. CrR25]
MKYSWPFLALFLSACNEKDNPGSTNMTTSHPVIEVQFEQTIDSLIAQSPLEFTPDCMQPVGMCWYEISRRSADPNLPTVKVLHGAQNLTIEQVSDISIVMDDEVGQNINNLSITLRGLPDNSSHADTQSFIYALLETIQAAAWKHYYFPSDPRIPGNASDTITASGNVLGEHVMSHPWLAPDYRLDLKRWLEIGGFYDWYFYNDGVYLHLKARRHDSDKAPKERGTYLIKLAFSTEHEYWRGDFTEAEEKPHWKERLPERLEGYRQQRKELEDKARAAGIAIDENYQDPPIKALEEK